MKRLLRGCKWSCLAVILCFTHPAWAESGFLSPTKFDPATLLPPPPADGSDRQVAELAELHRIEVARTPQAFAKAGADGKNETVTMFAETLGPSFDIAKLPATAKLFSRIGADEESISKKFKTYFHRTRPYSVDGTLHRCANKPGKSTQTSYPSGHATVAYAMGAVLAKLLPPHAGAILARSSEFAENRLICGVHYRSDIEAGHVLGILIAERLEEDPEFRAEFNASKAELRAIGLLSL